jgi:hypothetical protein
VALLNINGVDLPSPSDLQVGLMDISKADRNAAGTMIIERIATKRKLQISYSYLSADDLKQVLSAVSPVFFTVTYPDPQTSTMRTGTFYSGDRTCPMIDYKNGVPRYKDVKFDLIER